MTSLFNFQFTFTVIYISIQYKVLLEIVYFMPKIYVITYVKYIFLLSLGTVRDVAIGGVWEGCNTLPIIQSWSKLVKMEVIFAQSWSKWNRYLLKIEGKTGKNLVKVWDKR